MIINHIALQIQPCSGTHVSESYEAKKEQQPLN